MQKIEEKAWGAIHLTEIFDTISRGKRIKKSDHVPGDVPYVSSTALANGTDGSCGNDKNVRKFSNCLTLANSGSVGSCFYHPYDFVASDHVTALSRDGTSADCYLGLSALVGRLGEKYNFNREINDTRISRECVMLPLSGSGEPDYSYIEEYIRLKRSALLEKYQCWVKTRIAELGENIDIPQLSEKKWQAFVIKDIADVYSGHDIYAQERVNGRTPLVTAVGTNNGVGYFVGNENDSRAEKSISVVRNGASVGKAFYHKYSALYGNDCRRMKLKHSDSEFVNLFIAKAEADKVDEQIIATLKAGRSFRVEAGAGSGKTYSLNRVIEWIQANKWNDYRRKKQNVICITYTNAAVDVIAERLSQDSFVLPSTIHSFAWNAIKQYQSVLIDIVTTNPEFLPDEGDFYKVTAVAYTLGHRYKENGIQYLYHDDVLKLFCLLLDNAKFRRVFADKYPLILIDEYQDSYKPIIDRFIEFFIAQGIGPQFGFFGDAWQTIYQSNKACGAIEHDNIEVIKKSSNFRSAPRIVQLLNDIRPDLPQRSAIDGADGEVVVITCEDYTGDRRKDRNFKDELPATELKARLNKVEAKIKQDTPDDEKLKILMITHKVLATQQGYEQLLDILGDGLRNKEDPFLLFFMNTVEPVYEALCTSNMQLLFDTLVKRYPITKKSEKAKWQKLRQQLDEARSKRAIDVLELLYQTDLIPVPPNLDGYYRLYHDAPNTMYNAGTSIQTFLELEYSQFLAVIDFLYPEAVFSTEHGVKGEEYDNVVFVISKGWNQYQFETYAPMITGYSPIPKGKEAAFERNRNLFYVCCSRPKKRLFFFVTVPIEPAFRAFLISLVGEENIHTYQQFVEMES